MIELFYSFGIFALVYELCTLWGIIKSLWLREQSSIKAFIKPRMLWIKMSFGIIYWVWIYIGLFTSQWLLFIAILILSLINKKHPVIRIIDAILSMMVIVIILLNKYYLHLELFDYILVYVDKILL